MIWKIEFHALAAKEFKKLDKNSQREIIKYLRNRVLKSNHPKDLGKALRHGYSKFWRYRISKFRIICNIQEGKLLILILKVALRDKVYR